MAGAQQEGSGNMPESLEKLAIGAILRAWVAGARPGSRLAGFSTCAAIALRNMQDLLQCPCPRTDGSHWRDRLEELQREAALRERQLMSASRTIPVPADRLPLPLVLRQRWEAAAHAFFVELTSWHLHLYRMYLIDDPTYDFVHLFLSCAAVSESGGLARDVTLLGVLDRSMFHEGMVAARLSQAGLGVARVRGAAERVLARLYSGEDSTFPAGTHHLYPHEIERRVNTAVRLHYVTSVERGRGASTF